METLEERVMVDVLDPEVEKAVGNIVDVAIQAIRLKGEISYIKSRID